MNLFDFFTPKSEAHYLTEDMTIRQALEKFDYHKFSVVPVIGKDGRYITTVSEGDILRYIKNRADFNIQLAEDVPVLKIERYRSYRACSHVEPLDSILRLALEQNFVPIVDDRNLFIGIVKRKSIIKYYFGEFSKGVSTEQIQ